MEDAEDGTLFVLGNLLLDMVLPVEEKYLQSYNLVPDSIQTADKNHFPMYDEILKSENVVISPGGSALNTVRMAQRILSTPNKIVLLGAVGSDETGQLLVNTVQKEGIKLLAQNISDTNVATGRCASLLTKGGSQRTMVTDLGASLKFSHETWLNSEIDLECVEKAKFVYISGYFLKVSPETAKEVAKRVKRRRVPIILNLNAVWVTTCCKQEIQDLLPFVDVLVGNDAEVKSFVGEMELGLQSDETILKVACDLSLFMERNNNCKASFTSGTLGNKVVIVTRGDLPVIVVEKGNVKEYNVQRVLQDDIVDSTGAGDAFVGGFLACYIQRKSLDECITCGIWAATEELKGYGFILPSKVPQRFVLN